MKGVYLSLNQAMTEARENYRSDAKTALKARAENFRAILGSQIDRFPLKSIDLAPDAPNNDTSFYEAGNICAIYYKAGEVPQDEKILADLKSMIRLYEALILGQVDADVDLDAEGDVPKNLQVEDATKFRLHKRIERNAKLVRDVKRIKGCVCEVCGLKFDQRYGVIGLDYIEAHHLKPISSLKGTKVAMDPGKDFAVLCANCHRMVHRSGLTDDIAKFKAEHFHG
jgi:5-methylcytosine-specific restriction protein A